jgi:hypothetical protein
MPRDVTARIRQVAAKTLTAQGLVDRLRVTCNEPVGTTPEAFAVAFKAGLAKFAKVVKDANIPVQD